MEGSSVWVNLCIFLILILILITIFKIKNPYSEGFSQNERFILKKNEEIYDDFYVNIYDKIHLPYRRVPYELKTIIDTTQPDENNSFFLDVGSGTGVVVNELNSLGYSAIGIDNSPSMINFASTSFSQNSFSPTLRTEKSIKSCSSPLFKQGNVENMLMFERGKFTHILCLYFTIYHFKNKHIFFRNCYSWLKPGGYLIIHLVNKDKFDTIVPVGKNLLFGSPQLHNENRITKQLIDFNQFKYKVSYDFSSNTALLTETFEDSTTNNIRQNERTMYMEDIDDILNMAILTGFVPNANISYSIKPGEHENFKPFDLKEVTEDPYQYLYILERPL